MSLSNLSDPLLENTTSVALEIINNAIKEHDFVIKNPENKIVPPELAFLPIKSKK